MALIVDLNVSYNKLLVSPKDFVTLMEIFERSKIVDWRYAGDESYLVEASSMLPESRMFKGEVLTKEQFDAMKAEKENRDE